MILNSGAFTAVTVPRDATKSQRPPACGCTVRSHARHVETQFARSGYLSVETAGGRGDGEESGDGRSHDEDDGMAIRVPETREGDDGRIGGRDRGSFVT